MKIVIDIGVIPKIIIHVKDSGILGYVYRKAFFQHCGYDFYIASGKCASVTVLRMQVLRLDIAKDEEQENAVLNEYKMRLSTLGNEAYE
jgi:hypothetical protein